ncbi:hypothetical protein AU476_27875 [Cupriavidus sp. UYMSc13B]|nr:hypothetical protein AU476_27875 [Cupriavidus sp. UYMSc13B]
MSGLFAQAGWPAGPYGDHIAHLWLWDLKRWQDIQRPGRGLTVTGPFAHRALEQLGQIGAMPAEGETGELPTNPSDHAARRLAAFERLRAITHSRVHSTGTRTHPDKALLLRFERLSHLHYALKTLAYTMINLRHYCRS